MAAQQLQPILDTYYGEEPSPSTTESASGSPASSDCIQHGSRNQKQRRRKGVDEYVAEYDDFMAQTVHRDGEFIRLLVCRFCFQAIGSRSDRIKEHLSSKRHEKKKMFALNGCTETESAVNMTLGQTEDPFGELVLRHLIEIESPRNPHNYNGLRFPGLTKYTPPGEHVPASGLVVNVKPKAKAKPKPAELSGLLCVKWGNYDLNLNSMFSKFRLLQQFCDVSIYCGGKTIKCHRIVLSACSTYFEQVFKEQPDKYPIIFLTDVKHWEVEALVDFMYQGHTTVHESKLKDLLRAAKVLQIKGLGVFSAEELHRLSSGVAGKYGIQKKAIQTQPPVGDRDVNHTVTKLDADLPTASGVTNSVELPVKKDLGISNLTNSSAQHASSSNASKPFNSKSEMSDMRKRKAAGYQGLCPLPIKKRMSMPERLYPNDVAPGASLLRRTDNRRYTQLLSQLSPTQSLRRASADNPAYWEPARSFAPYQDQDEDIKIVDEIPFRGVAQVSEAKGGKSLLRKNNRQPESSTASNDQVQVNADEEIATSLSGSDFWIGLNNYQYYERIMNNLVPRDATNSKSNQ